MIETNMFPEFVGKGIKLATLREDATSIDSTSRICELEATDKAGQTLTWDLRTLPNGKKMQPTMADNTAGSAVAKLFRGDKILFVSAATETVRRQDGSIIAPETKTSTIDSGKDVTTNTLILEGEGIDFEREAWASTPIVTVVAEVDDGRGGSARRRVEIEIQDVNESPAFKSSGYSITVWENATSDVVLTKPVTLVGMGWP